MSKTRVFVAVPSMGSIADGQVSTLRDLARIYADTLELVYPAYCVQRRFHDFARNGLVEEFLESDCDILWFLDSDVTPPRDILDIIVEHQDKWQVAGAPYPVFMSPAGAAGGTGRKLVFTVYQGTKEGGMAPSAIPLTGTEFVDGIATGCLFIKRDVFKQLTKPYFEFKYRREDMQLIEGEDIGFCLKLKKLGIRFFVDYSKACAHQKDVDLLEINDYTLQYAKAQVDKYDALIRGQVKEAVQAAYNKGLQDGATRGFTSPGVEGQALDQRILQPKIQLILPTGFGSPSPGQGR